MTQPSFAGVELTHETILRTREHFCDIYRACMEEVRSGKRTVNDPEGYFAWREEALRSTQAGEGDHTLTFLQRAHSLQTGECVALLP